ncbi:DUF2946 family protein [Sodalis sp. RH21]|uniref:DUF2946 family protein n=1 Tax=unclassified Sodalis (in: enterobacteria) TaxID=2636512 RepID=UPI0039B52245
MFPLPAAVAPITRYPARRGRCAAWLGIWALLMLFIAPVISQSLERARAGAAPGGMLDGREMGHAVGDAVSADTMGHAMAHAPFPRHPDRGGSLPHSMPMSADFACGYCLLLIHLPLLDAAGVALFWSAVSTAGPPPAQPGAPLLARLVFPAFLARGPPARIPVF